MRKLAGQILFNRLIFPSSSASSPLQPFNGDYGHGFLYEELFSGDGCDLEFAARWCAKFPGPILDLAGGAGRLAIRLAEEQHRVHLVDRSNTMLGMLRKKLAERAPHLRDQIQICPMDMESMDLDREFTTIFSLNNGLEHPNLEMGILSTLRNVHRHLESQGRFFVDVHNLEHLESNWHFQRGAWHYTQDKKVNNLRYRVWSRTYPGKLESQTVCEHALSSDLNRFLLLKTTIHFFNEAQWTKLFEVAGFKVESVWGDWKQSPVDKQLPKLAYCLKKRGCTV